MKSSKIQNPKLNSSRRCAPWSSVDYQRKRFDQITLQNFQSLEDWKHITKYKALTFGIRTIFHYYYNLRDVLLNLYPNYPWNFEELKSTGSPHPKNYWRNPENQKNFLENIAPNLNIRELDDWYLVRPDVIVQYGGKSLLSSTKGILGLLKSAYPHHNWEIRRIKSSKKFGYIMDDKTNTIDFTTRLVRFFGIQKKEDWFRISKTQLRILFNSSMLITRSRGLYQFVSDLFPDVNWNKSQFTSKSKKSSQRWLWLCATRVFPSQIVYEEYTSSRMRYDLTDAVYEYDVFIPSLNIALEYNGEQHYDDIASGFCPSEVYKYRDYEKKLICKNERVVLISIPYWWDLKESSLAIYTINHFCSVILSSVNNTKSKEYK